MDVPIDISAIVVETERLIIRPWQEADLRDINAYASVPGVGEMAGWPYHKSLDESRKILQMFMNGKNEFALFHRLDKKVIGSFAIKPSSWANEDERYMHLKMKDIGYVVAKEYWGQGLAPEAAKAIINYCFTQLELDAITCGHFKTNPQSRRVIEKCGFKLVGEGTYYSNQLQQHFDVANYILKKD